MLIAEGKRFTAGAEGCGARAMLDFAGMKLKPLAERVKRTVSQPDHALIIELVSGALLLAWMAHWGE